MSFKNTTTAYGSVTKFFHWFIFILILCMLIAGFVLGYVPEAYQAVGYNLHKLTGLSILILMLMRLVWSLVNPKPNLPAGVRWYEHVLERGVHGLIYLVVIGMPLAGWIGSVAGGRPPHLGRYLIMLPIEQNKELSENAFTMHNTLAFTLITLLTIHILAALYHHFIRKDDVLRRMMPGR